MNERTDVGRLRMRVVLFCLLAAGLWVLKSAPAAPSEAVSLHVDAADVVGPMTPYAADGLKRALPSARIGGPHVTGPNGQRTQQLLRDFIEHCLRGTNHATGKTGAPLDFVAFHAKGAPRVIDGHVRMGISNHLRAIDNGFRIAASFRELAALVISRF
jgi:hypothetical protein